MQLSQDSMCVLFSQKHICGQSNTFQKISMFSEGQIVLEVFGNFLVPANYTSLEGTLATSGTKPHCEGE